MAVLAAAVDLAWVEEWVARVRDHVYVRREDNVFIRRPNQAFKLNAAGVDLLRRLFDGESLEAILAPHRGNPAVWRDVERFLLDVRTMLKDGLADTYESTAVEKIPFDLVFSDYPVLSEVAVTYRCNAACVFCYAGCNCTTNPVGNDREMSLDAIRTVLRKIRRQAKVPSVSFTGGEATLRPDLPEMIRTARSLDMRVNLVTNGIRCTPDFVQVLAEAGLQSAQISLEGTCHEIHEAITRVPGSFGRAVAAVRAFAAAGLNVHTNTTITRANMEDVLAMPAFVREELGLEAFSMNLVIPTGSASLDETLVVRYREAADLLVEIMDASKREGVEFKWYSPTPLCIFNPILHGLGNKGCSACDGLISVGADGSVLPCASYDEPVGDLLEQDFPEIWSGEKAREFREKGRAHDLCRACEHFNACNGACPLYWRHVGYAELHEARERAGEVVA